MHYDEDAEVYINGALAVNAPGYNDDSDNCNAPDKSGTHQGFAVCEENRGGTRG